MTTKRRLHGYRLRCVLTLHLFQNGRATVTDLIDMLDFHGFEVAGRASKVVSDALRCEMAHGRVRRLRRGQYGPVSMPRATEHRIHRMALALREEAGPTRAAQGTTMNAASDDRFWDALLEA